MEGEVVLTESATVWLIEIDGDCLLSENDADISEEDRRDLASPNRQTNPLLIKGRATQTITAPMVSEKEQTTPLILKDQKVQATGWELYDAFNKSSNQKEETKTTVSPVMALGRSLTSNEIAQSWADMVAVSWPQDPLQSNDDESSVKVKWAMSWVQEDRNIRVNGIHCNPCDRMVFIVTYENPKTHKGFITCWNIQNMDEPEIIVSTSSNPTVACFCSQFPRLVAVGDETGMVHFVDIGSQLKQLGADNVPDGGHMGTVTDLCWMGQKVLSTGDDGRVLVWIRSDDTTTCSQVVAQLQPSFYNLELPRTMKYCNSSIESLPIPSAQSCAVLADDSQFIVGSEDGSIHVFTFMQNYVPLTVKRRHIGPVCQIEVIHFEGRHILVSLGHDNMIYLEDLGSGRTQQVFHESKVADSSGKPLSSNSHDSKVEQGVIVAFACNPDDVSMVAILKQQTVEMWRVIPAPLFLGKSRIPEPFRKVARFTTIQFIPKTTALLVGDDGGRIHVVSFTNLVDAKASH